MRGEGKGETGGLVETEGLELNDRVDCEEWVKWLRYEPGGISAVKVGGIFCVVEGERTDIR